MKKLFILLFIMMGMVYAQQPNEIIPYRFVLSDSPQYECWLELEVIALPMNIKSNDDANRDEETSIIEEKILNALLQEKTTILYQGKEYGLLEIRNAR